MRNPRRSVCGSPVRQRAAVFLVQPMFAKLLLPRFGSSPAVWTTCMLFFQSALLAGALQPFGREAAPAWQQAAVHLVVIALPI